MKQAIIVGSGFSGLGMAIRLKQAGIDDFTILEKGSEVGGTWRDNHYPGAACDVASHLYSFSFERNPSWSRMYASQPEILHYLIHCAKKYDLRRHLRLDTEVLRASFDEKRGAWTVETRGGESLEARALIVGCGALSRPILPDIPGLETFEGKMFHSARWDGDYPLDGKRVAVIGTGASAIQIVPQIAPRVERLFVFQRTPPWILPKFDGAIGPRAQAIFRHSRLAQGLARGVIYALTEMLGLGFVIDPRLMAPLRKLASHHLEESVTDPVLRAKLTPGYSMGCKRVLIANDYYPALLRSNVELVTDAIRAIGPRGVATARGVEREVDAMVLATGFQAAEAMAPFEIRGQAGRELNDTWRDGAEAYLGTMVAGFPNLFMMFGPNTTLGHSSMIYMFESQMAYVLGALRALREKQLKHVSVREDVQRSYNRRLRERLDRSVWASGCTSWYRTKQGKNTTLWPGFTFEFRYRTRRFDASKHELV